MTTMKIVIHEVGPRDGLQVEKQVVPTATKLDWLTRLICSGICEHVDSSNFVIGAAQVPT